MPHIVEVRHIGTDLAASTAELRNWLDKQRLRPAAFEHSAGGPGITFRVHFAEEGQAAAFADAFNGWLNCGVRPCADALWSITVPSASSTLRRQQASRAPAHLPRQIRNAS